VLVCVRVCVRACCVWVRAYVCACEGGGFRISMMTLRHCATASLRHGAAAPLRHCIIALSRTSCDDSSVERCNTAALLWLQHCMRYDPSILVIFTHEHTHTRTHAHTHARTHTHAHTDTRTAGAGVTLLQVAVLIENESGQPADDTTRAAIPEPVLSGPLFSEMEVGDVTFASPFRASAVSMTTCANVCLLWSALESVCVGRKEARAGALGERSESLKIS
jgi:hypothetical protein